MPPVAGYIPVLPSPIFGIYHPPRGDVSDVALLCCPPFGWDDVCSYRARRSLAEALAAVGHPVLRFDLPSAGDSAGAPGDDDRLAAWIAAADGAARWLRASSGAQRVAALGVGLGGMVAWAAAASAHGGIDDLILWAVPQRGSRLLREIRMFARVESEYHFEPGPVAPADGLAAAGFVLSPATVAALGALDLGALELPPAPGRRVLLLGRDGQAADPGLRQAAERSGATVTTCPGLGYGAMMALPDRSVAPLETGRLVAAWLREGAGPGRAMPPPAGGGEVAIPFESVTLRERVLTGARRFAIVTERDDAAEPDLALVLLNAGTIRHTGPARTWVEAARRTAAAGVPAVRLDLEGIGDAPGDGDRYRDVAEMYDLSLVDAVCEALDELAAQSVARRFVLAGLCSGAYWAFHAALHDPRVAGAVVLNPQVLFWDSALASARAARATGRALGERRTWRRVLRGDVAPDLAVRRIRALAAAPRGARRRAEDLDREVADRDRIEAALDVLERAGTRLDLVFSQREPLRSAWEQDGRLAAIGARTGVSVTLIGGSGHLLRDPRQQAVAHDVIDHAVSAVRGVVRPDAAHAAGR